MNTILQKFIWSLPVTLLAGAQVYPRAETESGIYLPGSIPASRT